MAAVVVGAAVVGTFDGTRRVLAGERAGPAALAGRWEFPGGKVEPGETETQALVRECQEELGIEIEVGSRLGGDLDLPGGGLLKVFEARLAAGTPTVTEHRQVRWLAADELASVPWLDTNRPLLDPLRALLRISS